METQPRNPEFRIEPINHTHMGESSKSLTLEIQIFKLAACLQKQIISCLIVFNLKINQ